MSNRSAARGRAAASSIRLTSRTSKAVAISKASPSRCFLFCPGSRAARSAPTAAATVSIPPIPGLSRITAHPLQSHQGARTPRNLMGGKVSTSRGVGAHGLCGGALDLALQAEIFQLAVERRAADAESARHLRYVAAVMPQGEADDVGFDLVQAADVAGHIDEGHAVRVLDLDADDLPDRPSVGQGGGG